MPAERETHYDVLAVSQSAKEQDIRRSFRRLALAHHPDRPGGNADLFKRAVEAYEVLSDRKKRAEYDSSIATFAWSKSAAQSAAGAASAASAASAANGTSRRRPPPDFEWSFFNAAPRRSTGSASTGTFGSRFSAPFEDSFKSSRGSRRNPFAFPFSLFDSFEFPDPPFAHAEPADPPPRRPRSSRYEQMRADQKRFAYDSSSDENDSDGANTASFWRDQAEAEMRQAETERRRAEAERRRAEVERRQAEAERRRAKNERMKAEGARMRAEAERKQWDATIRARVQAQLAAQMQAQVWAEADAQAHAQAKTQTQTQTQAETETQAQAGRQAQVSVQENENADTARFEAPGAAESDTFAGSAAGNVDGSRIPASETTRASHSRRRLSETEDESDLESDSAAVDSRPRPKRPRLDPDIIDLTVDDETTYRTTKHAESSPGAHFNMSDMRHVPPFTERNGTSFDLNGMQDAVPSKENVRVRQQNRMHFPPAEETSVPRGPSPEEARLWSEYVTESYAMYDKLFKLHNERNELVEQHESKNRDAVIANLRETAEWLAVLLQGTQSCLQLNSQ